MEKAPYRGFFFLAWKLHLLDLVLFAGVTLDQVATSSYNISMRAVGIKVLKNQLSAYVRLAAAGEEILVTERDRVVAELGPPRADRSPRVADALLADAVRQGLVTPALARASALPARRPVATWKTLQAELEADRADR